MNYVRINIAQLLMAAFLTVFSFELVIPATAWGYFEEIALELPFEAEEEEEKTKNGSEIDDKIVHTNPLTSFRTSHMIHEFIYHGHFSVIPREIVTPPPE